MGGGGGREKAMVGGKEIFNGIRKEAAKFFCWLKFWRWLTANNNVIFRSNGFYIVFSDGGGGLNEVWCMTVEI